MRRSRRTSKQCPSRSHRGARRCCNDGWHASTPRKESLIAADLTIEGKIEGGGSVRIAGKFKGDVNVQGDLTIEAGAKLIGSVRADKVVISGELEGNVLGHRASTCSRPVLSSAI
jgi:hypothetical protein